MRQARFDAFDHQANGFGLVAGRLETGDELKLGHDKPLCNRDVFIADAGNCIYRQYLYRIRALERQFQRNDVSMDRSIRLTVEK
ncbi:hypothetical protein D3C77_621930 [compost metagenome]